MPNIAIKPRPNIDPYAGRAGEILGDLFSTINQIHQLRQQRNQTNAVLDIMKSNMTPEEKQAGIMQVARNSGSNSVLGQQLARLQLGNTFKSQEDIAKEKRAQELHEERVKYMQSQTEKNKFLYGDPGVGTGETITGDDEVPAEGNQPGVAVKTKDTIKGVYNWLANNLNPTQFPGPGANQPVNVSGQPPQQTKSGATVVNKMASGTPGLQFRSGGSFGGGYVPAPIQTTPEGKQPSTFAQDNWTSSDEDIAKAIAPETKLAPSTQAQPQSQTGLDEIWDDLDAESQQAARELLAKGATPEQLAEHYRKKMAGK